MTETSPERAGAAAGRSPSRNAIRAVLVLGMLIFYRPYSDFQAQIAQGDHGANLYAYQQVARGQALYREVFYPYGPLMPHYYGAAMNLFGESIRTVVQARTLASAAAVIIFFFILARLVPPLLALAGALWFMVFDYHMFYYTFNHTGTLPFLLGVVFAYVAFVQRPSRAAAWAGFACALAAGLVRVNMGFFLLAAFTSLALAVNHRRRALNPARLLLAAAATALALGGTYALLYAGLTPYQKRLCLGFFNTGHYDLSLWHNVGIFIDYLGKEMTRTPARIIFSLIFAASLARVALGLYRRQGLDRDLMLSVGGIAVFWLACSHEFFASGTPYRLAWITPLQTLLVFLIIGWALRDVRASGPVKAAFMTALVLLPVATFPHVHRFVRENRRPEHYLPPPRGLVYSANPTAWFDTVRRTTDHLNATLGPGETFLALPYEPIYYFLTGRESPSYALQFFQSLDMPVEEERKLIRTLEDNRINTIVLSNRLISHEKGLGAFGRTHNRLLFEYIRRNYWDTRTYGPWKIPALWIHNHAVKIFTRMPIPDGTIGGGGP